MKIMIFLHGTIIMHQSGLGKTPQERTKQVEENEAFVHRYDAYVPVDQANTKLAKWVRQGAKIVYLSSHQNDQNVKKDIKVLKKYNFPEAPVLYRQKTETYAQIAERAMPDILIEDDCKSIGGAIAMTYPHISPLRKRMIHSIVVKEFSGIDDLPDDLQALPCF